MKTIVLTRIKSGDHGTFGELEVDGEKFVTGELPWRDNARGKSCIPAGEYVLAWIKSPKFGWTYEIAGVPNRDHVLVHSGNVCGDVDQGLESDVEGCVLLGGSKGIVKDQEAVVGSKAAVARFNALLGKESARIRIVDEYLEAGTPAHVQHVPV